MVFRTEGILDEANRLETGEASVSVAERQFSAEASAADFFNKVKSNLLNISHWNHKSGLSSYELFDATGASTNDESISLGSFIKITLYGSGKSDWVRVEDIYDSEFEAVITVRPAFDPTGDPPQTGKTSHFFTNEATNNFCAFQKNRSVFLYVIGLNERLNHDHTSNILESARNAAVANLGYYTGIQKGEWTKFCNSFLFDGEEPAE